MTVYQERKDELERYEFMMGVERGRLAVPSCALEAGHCVNPEIISPSGDCRS